MITTRVVFSLLLIFGAFAIGKNLLKNSQKCKTHMLKPSGNSLDCTVCSSVTSWDDCKKNAQVKTCTLAGVNEAHALMAALYNPNLVQGTAQDEFACFAFQANLKNPSANEAPVVFARDCTFKKVEFCKGWLERVEVVKCGTNPAGDVDIGGAGGLRAMGALVVAGFVAVYLRL